MVARSFHCDETRLRSLLEDDVPELEQTELTDHLETCTSCRQTLERLAAGTPLWAELRELASASKPTFNAPPSATELYRASRPAGAGAERDHLLDFLAPSGTPGSLGRLGPYEVTELLGRGGFGVVLRALDPALGRVVAIKVLAPELATSAAARGRFAREARAAAAVVHDHVVAIHAVDSWNNLPYLVMPLVAGRSLQERVDRDGPMGVKEVLRIGIQTAQGLAAAHDSGLVHRDVKPSNILLENGVERVKLTDFGLARAVDDASLTQSGVVTGTPQYMSPEQARGEAVDHRSDLFSLGSVLYFMCAGHPPFRASSTPAVLRRVSDERPRPLREVNLEIPDWLASLVDRLHEKDPAHRLQSAREVALTLGRHLADLQRGVHITVPQKPPYRSNPRSQWRKPLLAAAVIIPALALVVATNQRRDAIFPMIRAAAQPEVLNAVHVTAGIGQDRNLTIINEDEDNARIIGSGTPATKIWDFADFDRLVIASTFRAQITKGTAFKVTTTADDNVLPRIRVVKAGKTLKLSMTSGSYRLKTPLTAEITLPTVVALDVGGASRGTLKGFQSEKELAIKVSGSSKLEGGISLETADFAIDGASTLSLVGSAQTARLSAHGSSHLMLGEFPLKDAQIELNGASSAQVAVKSDALFKAEASGSSTLKGSIQAKRIELELDGASRATLEGAADSAKIHASGSSNLTLGAMILQNAEINLSGASHASVNTRGQLKYDLSSSSSLKYLGDPKTLDGSKSGGASISRGAMKRESE
jgi:eukaryotic-like serine/threonine-protein kinase